jgi:hypothetical protein
VGLVRPRASSTCVGHWLAPKGASPLTQLRRTDHEAAAPGNARHQIRFASVTSLIGRGQAGATAPREEPRTWGGPGAVPTSRGLSSGGVSAPVHMQKRPAPPQEVGGAGDRFAPEPLAQADVDAHLLLAKGRDVVAGPGCRQAPDAARRVVNWRLSTSPRACRTRSSGRPPLERRLGRCRRRRWRCPRLRCCGR